MKKIFKFVLIVTALVPIFMKTALAEKVDSIVVSSAGYATSRNVTIDVSRYDRLSVQASYFPGPAGAVTVRSGSRASATLTVTNYNLMISTNASVSVRISSNAYSTGLAGDTLTVDGNVFKEGVNWSAGTGTGLPLVAATNLMERINATPGLQAYISATEAADSTVTVRYADVGSIGNGKPVTTTDSTYMKISAATLTGGINRQSITINGTTLTEGVDFRSLTSNNVLAAAIKAAIDANATIIAQSSASVATNVITLKNKYPGQSSFSWTSSSGTWLTINNNMPVGLVSDVDIANNLINYSTHQFTTGIPLLLTGANPPTGLTTGTTYFAINLNDSQFRLSTTSTGAVAGSAITLTAVTDSASNVFTPTIFAAAAGNGFYWQASNDGVGFGTLSISSVTYSTAGTTLWDLGEFGYRYLRAVFLGPTQGAIGYFIKFYGRKD